MIDVKKLGELMWREDAASRSLGMKLVNQRALAASCSIDFVSPAFLDDELTAVACEIERKGRHGIYDVRVANQNGDTVALFRGKSATVKGNWV